MTVLEKYGSIFGCKYESSVYFILFYFSQKEQENIFMDLTKKISHIRKELKKQGRDLMENIFQVTCATDT